MKKNLNNKVLESAHVAAYKMVVNFDKTGQETNLFSIDTGMNGNPLQGRYFDMNNDHIYGRLQTMKIGDRLDGTPINVLTLKHKNKDSDLNDRKE